MASLPRLIERVAAGVDLLGKENRDVCVVCGYIYIYVGKMLVGDVEKGKRPLVIMWG